VHRPDDDFTWHGVAAASEEDAFNALAECWSRWLNWAGLEQVEPLERGT
jgi:hypothetical protein